MDSRLGQRFWVSVLPGRSAGWFHDLWGGGVTSNGTAHDRDRDRFTLGSFTVTFRTLGTGRSVVLVSKSCIAIRGGVAAGTSRIGHTRMNAWTAITCLQKSTAAARSSWLSPCLPLTERVQSELCHRWSESNSNCASSTAFTCSRRTSSHPVQMKRQ